MDRKEIQDEQRQKQAWKMGNIQKKYILLKMTQEEKIE